MSAEAIVFGDCELDLARNVLRRGGETVSVEPRVFDLIAFIAARPGELVTKDALIDAIWDGRAISDSAISSCVAAARAAIGDTGEAQRLIQTVPRRGFRFVGDVAAHEPVRHAVSAKPSIAVLPFKNMSGDPEQAFFSDGITDDIITDLARYRELFVIARHSSFSFRESGKSAADIAGELGVQYIVDGAIRRAGNRIRVSISLFDPGVGQELWAERYDRELGDIFEVQDEITSMIVNRLAGQISRQHYKRVMAKETGVTTYHQVLRAQEGVFRVSRDDSKSGLELLRQVLEIEPDNARAHALTSWYYLSEANNAWGMAPADAFKAARAAAQTAVRLDENDPLASAALAWVYLWQDRQHDRAIETLERTCALNPSNATYRAYLAFAQIYAGEHGLGKANLELAMRMNPLYPAFYDNHYMRAVFHLGDSEAAYPHAERVRLQMSQASTALSLAAAIFASLGRTDEARAVVDQIAEVSPGFTLSYVAPLIPYRRDEDRDYYLGMLERAGLPA